MGIASRIRQAKTKFRTAQKSRIEQKNQLLERSKKELERVEKESLKMARLERDIRKSKANIRSQSKVRKFGRGLQSLVNKGKEQVVKAKEVGFLKGSGNNPFGVGNSGGISPFGGGTKKDFITGKPIKPVNQKVRKRVTTTYV